MSGQFGVLADGRLGKRRYGQPNQRATFVQVKYQ